MRAEDGHDVGAVFGGVVDGLNKQRHRRQRLGFAAPDEVCDLAGLDLGSQTL